MLRRSKDQPSWGGGLSLFTGMIFLGTILMFFTGASQVNSQPAKAAAGANTMLTNPVYLPAILKSQEYIVLAWNDLGMHCYNRDFQYLAVLPPYNTLWAQVIKRGDPPQIITSGIRVQYRFPDNTKSTTKSNFWQYAPKLFGVNLPDNVGLTGRGLAGVMDVKTSYFIADGIPLTEFTDTNPTVQYPYQIAEITAKNSTTGATLATLTVVAPVSTEMHCDTCHAKGKEPGGSSDIVELNILNFHDDEEQTNLANSTPVLCANCHSSNALGKPGRSGVPSLSNAMHRKHNEVFPTPNTTDTCYSCHPGPTTKCMRDVMSLNVQSKIDPTRKMNCIDCHGGLAQVAKNPNPWLNEPRCDTCHQDTTTKTYKQDQALYRFSKGHGGVYCEGCHDSTHAIATSREPNDAIKFIQLQGHTGTLNECTVCHLSTPSGKGPHQK